MGKESSIDIPSILNNIKFICQQSIINYELAVIFSILAITGYLLAMFLNPNFIIIGIIETILVFVFGIYGFYHRDDGVYYLERLIELIDEINQEYECPLCKSHNLSWSIDKDYITFTCMNCGYKWYLPTYRVRVDNNEL